MENKKTSLDGRFEIKSLTEDGTFSGYGSVFGNEDLGGDIVAAGAFTETIKAHALNKTMPALLWQHNPDDVIGKYTKMAEDERGLYVEGQLCLDTVKGKEAYALLKMGAMSGLSIGYWPTKWEWDDKNYTRTLKEVDLWETSIVTFPMNDKARIGDVKSLDDIKTVRDVEHFLRDSKGFSKSEAGAVIASVKAALLRDAEEKADKEALENLLATLKG